ncbi:hypothetical protein DPEC_G00363450 [Dallia pectoralis]|nr:hypothetical protein DPEC_G00363450 [Dallia pectoralis]
MPSPRESMGLTRCSMSCSNQWTLFDHNKDHKSIPSSQLNQVVSSSPVSVHVTGQDPEIHVTWLKVSTPAGIRPPVLPRENGDQGSDGPIRTVRGHQLLGQEHQHFLLLLWRMCGHHVRTLCCIFMWRLAPELTISMRQRLSELQQKVRPLQKTPPHKPSNLRSLNGFTPYEIVFLRTMSPAHSFPHISSDIVFDILEGNIQNTFDIVKRQENGMILGEWRKGP